MKKNIGKKEKCNCMCHDTGNRSDAYCKHCKSKKWIKDFISPPKKTKGWEEGFDEEFPCESEMCLTGCICGNEEIKSFINQELKRERDKTIKECREYIEICKIIDKSAKEAKKFAKLKKLK